MLHRSFVIAVLAASLLAASDAGAADARIRHIRPPASPDAPRYTQAVVVEGGAMVFVSGQVAYDAQRRVVGKGDMRAQTRQVFENLKSVLAEAGTDLAHVVRLNAYLTDLNQLPAHREARNEYLDAANPPASTLVGVTRLVDPDLLLEIEAVAVVPQAKTAAAPKPAP
ncbi:MAG TPA: RidA family protein [Thermoanaerobaculia bacterium]|jgi:reactive intermediate/imine deaminase|nr:RidA family protein [Thermoanaerobaculia bacterium]